MHDSGVKYILNTWPLVDRKMTRADCTRWLTAHDLPTPPKSSCTFCPFHGIAQWKQLKRDGGPDWAEAVAVDEEVRDMRETYGHTLYVHPHRIPLEQAVHLPEVDGQMALELGLEQPCDSGVCFT